MAGIAQEVEYETHKVFRSVMSGVDFVEEEVEFPSKFIPIVPLIGEEVHLGERVYRHGIVRFAKDSQRSYNYWRSTSQEMIALTLKSPLQGTPAQFKLGIEDQYRQANKVNMPFTVVQPRPGRAPSTPRSSARSARFHVARGRDCLGRYEEYHRDL